MLARQIPKFLPNRASNWGQLADEAINSERAVCVYDHNTEGSKPPGGHQVAHRGIHWGKPSSPLLLCLTWV